MADDLVLRAERIVLGAMMTAPAVIDTVTALVQSRAFREARHGTIFATLTALGGADEPTDPVAVASKLGADLQRVGGLPYLHELVAQGAVATHPAGARFHAQQVADAARLRDAQADAARLSQVAQTSDLAKIREVRAAMAASWADDRDGLAASPFAATLMSRADLANLPTVRPLIDGVLDMPAAAVLFGPTGAGKTFTAVAWACCVVTGRPWLGRDVAQHPGLYVIGEGASGLDRRISAWESVDPYGTKVGDGLTISVKPPSFAHPPVWADLTAHALALEVRFVVLDTFSSLAPDADETKDAATFTRRLSDLAAAIDGVALVVHHPGWGEQDRTRGGYQLEANVDQVLRLAASNGSDVVELTRKKVKDGPSGARMWLRRRGVDLGIDEHGEPITSIVMDTATAAEVATPLRERIVSLLDGVPGGLSGPQILKELGTDKRSGPYKALAVLVSDDLVTLDGSRYRLRTPHE